MNKLKQAVKPLFAFIFPVLLTGIVSFSEMVHAESKTVIAEAENKAWENGLIFSAISGTVSRPDTFFLASVAEASVSECKIIGERKDAFTIISSNINEQNRKGIAIAFKPEKGVVGIVRAQLQVLNKKEQVLKEISLTGLSSKALEGENEPPLSRVFEALGYKINLGWTSLANHCKPQQQGDEIMAGLFKKAGKGLVKIIAVARYSPDFKLPFGYYTNETTGLKRHLVGTLKQAGKFPEHQTLFPRSKGSHSFDPQQTSFGFYVAGPDHVAYSQDVWNRIQYPKHTAHATRIYQARDADGNLLTNSYFVCFEEAANGDYNDYVFLIENVTPVAPVFTSLFNGKSLEGWDLYLENTGKADPNKNFRIENNTIHVIGQQAGYVITQKTYTNYHLKVDFKWGQKRWPPRENTKRDAGICYHIAPDEAHKVWPPSIECQIQEGDVGDFWLLGNTTIEVRGNTNKPQDYARIPNIKDTENPKGQWNTLEIISYNGKCIHVLNGEVVNYGKNASVRSGRILLQSEYAEIFYKNIKIRVLP